MIITLGTKAHILEPKCQELILPREGCTGGAVVGDLEGVESPSRIGSMRWLLRYY